MRVLAQDLRYALRQLRKSPGFTSVAIITLGLGIGATTAIFSVVYGVLLRPLPYSDPNRIMAIFEVTTKGTLNRLADPNFDDFRDQAHSFQKMAKYSAYTSPVSGAAQPSRSTVAHVTPDFFPVFRVQPIIGRDFNAADSKKGAAPVALISYGYWKQDLGSSPDLSRLHLKIDSTDFSVIGVLPPGFQFPADTDLWVAADRNGENPSRGSHNYDAVGRLRDGVTVAQAKAEISAIGRRIHDAASEQNDFLLKDAAVVPLRNSMTGEVRPALLVLRQQQRAHIPIASRPAARRQFMSLLWSCCPQRTLARQPQLTVRDLHSRSSSRIRAVRSRTSGRVSMFFQNA